MLENLSLLAILIIIFWVGLMAYYFYISSRQQKLRQDIEALRARLEKDGQGED